MTPSSNWPDGHRFAFTIFDDTDMTTLDNGPIVYDLLTSLGFRITKSVWPMAARADRATAGETCADPGYLEWVLRLQAQGHEIGIHNVTDGSSTRDQTIAGLDRFREMFGHDPRAGADHAGNLEALYCGSKRLSGWRSALYRAAERRLQPERPRFSGEEPTSEYFWGDVCRERITYWRGLSFNRLNLLEVTPRLPYHDPARSDVNQWFTASHAPRCADLVSLMRSDRVDQLEARQGVCIMYAHLGLDVVVDGRINPEFEAAMTSLSRRRGWFAPVSDVLDHLRAQQTTSPIGLAERASFETRWIVDRVRSRTQLGPQRQTTPARS